MEIWEPKPPGTLRATPGLLQDPYTLPLLDINLLKPNDMYICCTTALTSRSYILNIYSTNIHTEYFKHAA